MLSHRVVRRCVVRRCAARSLVAAGVLLSVFPWTTSRAEEGTDIEEGRAIFVREWLPGDDRSHKGDGLGPVYNDTSCVACHNQGGVGGGGPPAKNAQLVSLFARTAPQGRHVIDAGSFDVSKSARHNGEAGKLPEDKGEIHPGFRSSNSLVLHRFSTDPEYAAFRAKLLGLTSNAVVERHASSRRAIRKDVQPKPGPEESISARDALNAARREADAMRTSAPEAVRMGMFTIAISERNTTALFGAGAIDAIEDSAILEGEARRHKDFPEIVGRAARLTGNRVGRFGWKGQKANLRDFVLTACAVEVGLHVPDEPQAMVPNRPAQEPRGLDLTSRQVTQLVSFIASLPAPQRRLPETDEEALYLAKGRELFASIGCAACHLPKLADVEGIYSDLLLHDMGEALQDTGNYGSRPSQQQEFENVPLVGKPGQTQRRRLGAGPNEWRTPPLWGLRDSAPYMHDGRAATIEQAIALHDGQGRRPALKFFELPAKEQLHVTLLLRSLAAPN